MGLWEKQCVSLVSTAHFRPTATGGPRRRFRECLPTMHYVTN